MKRGATREEIIRTTQELIARNGIRAVRVDEIVQTLGISKRTLYEMFADKNDLVGACLDQMSHLQRRRIVSCNRRKASNPLQRAMHLMNEYVDSLFVVGNSFLADVRRKASFAEQFAEHREFWHRELGGLLASGCAEGLLLPDIDPEKLTRRILNTLLELRLNNVPREELCLFNRTILRGAASRRGIELLDGSRRKGAEAPSRERE